jgi:hypothetical protein
MAVPAAPSQFTTILIFSLFFPVTFNPLIIPAKTTIAVQC